jgi:hypothetical protein
MENGVRQSPTQSLLRLCGSIPLYYSKNFLTRHAWKSLAINVALALLGESLSALICGLLQDAGATEIESAFLLFLTGLSWASFGRGTISETELPAMEMALRANSLRDSGVLIGFRDVLRSRGSAAVTKYDLKNLEK